MQLFLHQPNIHNKAFTLLYTTFSIIHYIAYLFMLKIEIILNHKSSLFQNENLRFINATCISQISQSTNLFDKFHLLFLIHIPFFFLSLDKWLFNKQIESYPSILSSHEPLWLKIHLRHYHRMINIELGLHYLEESFFFFF